MILFSLTPRAYSHFVHVERRIRRSTGGGGNSGTGPGISRLASTHGSRSCAIHRERSLRTAALQSFGGYKTEGRVKVKGSKIA